MRSGRRTFFSGKPQAFERLRACDFVQEVEIDVDEVRLGNTVELTSGPHQVEVPDLVGERASPGAGRAAVSRRCGFALHHHGCLRLAIVGAVLRGSGWLEV